jgi:hypothetical protein
MNTCQDDYDRGIEILESALARIEATKGRHYRLAFEAIVALTQIHALFECTPDIDKLVDPLVKKQMMKCTEGVYRSFCELTGITADELNKDRDDVMMMVHQSHS